MEKGDRFVWLYMESDHRFGERCEVIAVRGDKVDYKFIDHPKWSTATMPLSWTKSEKNYSPEEILDIRGRERKRRIRMWRV